MATYSSPSVTNVTPATARVVHAGLQTAYSGVYNASGSTLSASDVIQMCVVPHGAIIVDIQVSGHGGAASHTIKVGDGGDDDRFGTITLSATSAFLRTNAGTGHAYQYSLSDDATTRYDTIDLTVQANGSATTTASIVMTVIYYMPPR
jgi:hypothetical protein